MPSPDGPQLIKELYILEIFSHFAPGRTPIYGIGCATADSPLGPWTKYDRNPLLQNPGELVGVGRSALFRDKTGNLKIVFHAHKSKGAIHPREMYITDVRFRPVEGGCRMEIDPGYSPALIAE